MLNKFKICPNAYYNFLKNRKSAYHAKKQVLFEKIQQIYHENDGIFGHRVIQIKLAERNIRISKTTLHKYMNKELALHSIVRKKKPDYRKGKAHVVHENKLNQDFTAPKRNQKWCTDFTYLFLSDGSKRYNCSIIDLHDRTVIASLNSKKMDSKLAIETLKKALASQQRIKDGLLLHSDQGSQYTSKEFYEFCQSHKIVQSMSKAGYPYDNAPMERYYNSLKNEFVYHHYYHNDEELNEAIDYYAYVFYNHKRPHTFNGGLTPFTARYKWSKQS